MSRSGMETAKSVMRKLEIALAFVALGAGSLFGQQIKPLTPPQTARQALMEMFFSKTPGTLAKHLPAATLAALETSGALPSLQQYSLMASALQAQGSNFQTFETGSVLLATEDPKTQQRFEAILENDALRGDDDDIELSFQAYKNGQLQRTPFMPRTTFSMKMEGGIWKLNEISVTIHLPLADPDLLKSFTEGLKARTAGNAESILVNPASVNPASANPASVNPASAVTLASDAPVVAAMRTILTAETTYASSYPALGYTCTLSDLDGFGGGEPNEHQAMLINSGLASGKRYGYVFTLSGCSGAPASSFHLTAAASGTSFGRKTYCTDQTGGIRSSADGSPAACLASGTPMQ